MTDPVSQTYFGFHSLYLSQAFTAICHNFPHIQRPSSDAVHFTEDTDVQSLSQYRRTGTRNWALVIYTHK